MQLKQEGSNFQAKEKFEKALEVDPNYQMARVELAGVLAALNMLPEAVDELAKVKSGGKSISKYHCYKGLVNYKLGLDVWTKLAQNRPEYMYMDEGKVKFIKEGSAPEVQIDKLKKKIELDTTNFEGRYKLRGMYYDVATTELKQAVAENPKDTLAVLTLGLVYTERSLKNLAEKQLAALEKIDKKSASDLKFMMEYVEQGKKELQEYMDK